MSPGRESSFDIEYARGTGKGPCHNCAQMGHHAWECPPPKKGKGKGKGKGEEKGGWKSSKGGKSEERKGSQGKEERNPGTTRCR